VNVEVNEGRELKLLFLGISYGNDALRYFKRMSADLGYTRLTLGRIGNSNTSIREQLDSIYSAKPTEGLKEAHIYSAEGTRALSGDYREIIRAEEWDHIVFYQGPKHLAMPWALEPCGELAEELRRFCRNKEVRISYYMPWAHNAPDVELLYRTITAATEKHALTAKDIDAIIPAGTVIQSLRRMGYENGELTRDWGHMNYGFGRYAVGLLLTCCLLGVSPDEVAYVPTPSDVTEGEREIFREISPDDERNVKRAVSWAINNPFKAIDASE